MSAGGSSKTFLGTWRKAFAGRPERGLTLVESVMAIAILTIGLLSLFALHQAAISASQLSFRTSEATFLAQDMMEELMAAQYNRDVSNPSLQDDGDDPTNPAEPLAELPHNFDGGIGTKVNCLGGSPGGGAPIYTRSYDITPIDDDQYGRVIIKARVTFRMAEAGKNLHGVTLISTRSFDRYQDGGG